MTGRSWKPLIPNALSAFRLVAAPGLLSLAWLGQPAGFLTLLAASLLSDALDGLVARALRQTSVTGAKLDSWGDLVTYGILPLCVWWLWPDVVWRELPFVSLALAAFAIPPAVGWVKFGRLPSYHTWSAKGSAIATGIAVFLLLVFDAPVPFRAAAVFLALVACEEVAITAVLPEWRCNVRSVWHAVKLRRRYAH